MNGKPMPKPLDDTAEYLRDLFTHSLNAYMPELNRMKRMQDAYDCVIPPNWGTMSEVYLPIVRTTVEVAVPIMVDYLIPPVGRIFSMTPAYRALPNQVVMVSEDYFHHLVRNKMPFFMSVTEALKDTAKINLGYVKVFYDTHTPIVENINHIVLNGKSVGEDRSMGRGEEQTITNCKYVHWARVVPTPDGDDVDNVTCTFELDFIRSDQLEEMYAREEELDAEDRVYMGNPQEIIEDTRKGKLDRIVFPEWFVTVNLCGGPDAIAGVDKERYNQIARLTGNKKAPVDVPVLYCYFQDEHIWLANGKTIIRHDKAEHGLMATPLAKFTSIRDSGRWAPRSDADAGSDLAHGKNAMVNAVLDLMTYMLHPTAVRNRQMINSDQEVGLEPYQTIDSYGDASKAINYIQGPQLPPAILQMMDALGNENDNATGQPGALRGQGTAGVMRGGMHGFEQFLGTAFARPKLGGAVLECTGFLRLLSLIMIYEQTRMRSAVSYIVRDPDAENNFVEKTITPQEFCNAFVLSLNLRDKFMRSPVDRNFDLQIAPMLLKDPRYDWEAVAEELLFAGNHERFKKCLADESTMAKQMEMLKQMQAVQQEAKPVPGGTDQAEAGQKSQRVV